MKHYLLGLTVFALLSGTGQARAGLIASWGLDETSGPTAFDSSGNGHNGTYHGSHITYGVAGPAPGDRAISINTDSYLAADHVPLTQSITVITWARSAAATWNDFGWAGSDRDRNGFLLTPLQGVTTFGYYVMDATGTYYPITFYDAPNITQWHQYAVTYDSGTGIGVAYFDGTVVGIANLGITRLASFASTVQIGQDDPLLNSFYPRRYGNGSLDDIQIYDTALSGQEILNEFNNPNSVPEPASLTLLGFGVVSCLGYTWRQRRKASQGTAVPGGASSSQ